MEKVSILEVENALKQLSFEVETDKGVDSLYIIQQYIKQQREKQIKEGTLVV
jgi:hypothetical protein